MLDATRYRDVVIDGRLSRSPGRATSRCNRSCSPPLDRARLHASSTESHATRLAARVSARLHPHGRTGQGHCREARRRSSIRCSPPKSDAVNRELVATARLPEVADDCREGLRRCCKKPSKPLTQAGLDELLLRNRGYGGTIANMLKNCARPAEAALRVRAAQRDASAGTWSAGRSTSASSPRRARRAAARAIQGFLNNIEKDAFANATDAERLAIEAAGLRKPYKPKELPKPIGPGKDWTTADVAVLEAEAQERPQLQERRARLRGGAVRRLPSRRRRRRRDRPGPVAGRRPVRPQGPGRGAGRAEQGRVRSVQGLASSARPTSKTYVGKIVNDADGKYTIVVDPEDSTKVVEVKKTDVESVKPSNVSLMPDKLLNSLNENEVLDMLAYMLSRGDPNHPMFKR